MPLTVHAELARMSLVSPMTVLVESCATAILYLVLVLLVSVTFLLSRMSTAR